MELGPYLEAFIREQEGEAYHVDERLKSLPQIIFY